MRVFADFLAELTPPTSESCTRWTVFTYISSNTRGSGEGLILENNKGLVVEMSL
jgi:hypothetical protein